MKLSIRNWDIYKELRYHSSTILEEIVVVISSSTDLSDPRYWRCWRDINLINGSDILYIYLIQTLMHVLKTSFPEKKRLYTSMF